MMMLKHFEWHEVKKKKQYKSSHHLGTVSSAHSASIGAIYITAWSVATDIIIIISTKEKDLLDSAPQPITPIASYVAWIFEN